MVRAMEAGSWDPSSGGGVGTMGQSKQGWELRLLGSIPALGGEGGWWARAGQGLGAWMPGFCFQSGSDELSSWCSPIFPSDCPFSS